MTSKTQSKQEFHEGFFLSTDMMDWFLDKYVTVSLFPRSLAARLHCFVCDSTICIVLCNASGK